MEKMGRKGLRMEKISHHQEMWWIKKVIVSE
jgi:hypothetical protein